MGRIDNRDYIYVIWKDHNSGQKYIVGELSRGAKYQFKYRLLDVDKAKQSGFRPLVAFPNVNEVYKSNEMFPAFSSRLPDKRRKDLKEILSKYKLEKYDTFELLKRSGGKLPIDSLEFVDPELVRDI